MFPILSWLIVYHPVQVSQGALMFSQEQGGLDQSMKISIELCMDRSPWRAWAHALFCVCKGHLFGSPQKGVCKRGRNSLILRLAVQSSS